MTDMQRLLPVVFRGHFGAATLKQSLEHRPPCIYDDRF